MIYHEITDKQLYAVYGCTALLLIPLLIGLIKYVRRNWQPIWFLFLFPFTTYTSVRLWTSNPETQVDLANNAFIGVTCLILIVISIGTHVFKYEYPERWRDYDSKRKSR